MNSAKGLRYLATGTLICTLLFSGGQVVFAQTTNLQKALDDVKTKLDDLVTAKDKDTAASDLSLRIATFQKVIDFAIAEASDLKTKLATSTERDGVAGVKEWKKNTMDKIDTALTYYQAEEKVLQDHSSITLDSLRSDAETFKTFREKSFLPLANDVQDFLLLNREAQIFSIAGDRLGKVTADVHTLEKIQFKGASQLKDMLIKASSTLSEGEKTYVDAWADFMESVVTPSFASTTTSTTERAAAAPSATVLETTTTIGSSTEMGGASSTAGLAGQEPSIKDLAKNALDSVQATYQIFIEMSNLVRKLLT